MNYYKFSDLAKLKNFMMIWNNVTDQVIPLFNRGIIKKIYVDSENNILLDDECKDSYLNYLSENIKNYRIRSETVIQTSTIPLCEIETIDQMKSVLGDSLKNGYFTKNVFGSEEYSKLKVCAIDCEYSSTGDVTEIGFFDIKSNRSILFRLTDDKRKTKWKPFTVANGIEVVVKSTQQLFHEACIVLQSYDVIVLHGIHTDLKAFIIAGKENILYEKILIDTSTMYDTINQYSLNVMAQLLDIPEKHKYHNAGNDSWYVSEIFKKLVRIK